jgi:hypothetical protein
MIPLGYAKMNDINYHYFGIQFVGDIDVLGRILELRIPIESAKNDTYFYTAVQDSRAGGAGTPTGFQLLGRYDPGIWGKTYRFVELQAFNRTVILHNLPLYVVKAVGTIPEILLEVCTYTLVPSAGGNFLTRIVWVLQQAYGYAQYLTLAVPFLWIVMIMLFIVQPTRWNTCTAITGTIAVSQIVFTALVVYKDVDGQYGRVLSIVQPQMYLFLFVCAITGLRAYRTKNHKI